MTMQKFVFLFCSLLLSSLAVAGTDDFQALFKELDSQKVGEPNFKEAAKLYREEAEKGDALAQTRLAWQYREGKGVRQDFKQAAFWYQKAADQGYAEAQYNIGMMYYFGNGVSQNYAQAAIWTRKAAEQGNADAQYNLGVMFRDGQGVQQDYVQAHFWFNLALASGDQKAFENRKLVAMKMTGSQLREAQALLLKWNAKHAKGQQ